MKKITLILASISFAILISCKKNKTNDIELEILSKKLYAYTFDLKKDTINLLCFKVSNNSKLIYYINPIVDMNSLISKSVYKNGIEMRIFNQRNNKEVVYKDKLPPNLGHNMSFDDSIFHYRESMLLNLDIERLHATDKFRYYSTKNYRNSFFIHPNEDVYFEIYLNITDTLCYDTDRIGYADLKKGNEYYSKLYLASDSTTVKSELPRHILKTIEANHVKVYHGIIESKNRIPIKVLE